MALIAAAGTACRSQTTVFGEPPPLVWIAIAIEHPTTKSSKVCWGKSVRLLSFCRRGFTIVELLITVLVLATLIFLVAPDVRVFLDTTKLSSAVGEVNSALAFARSEAMKRGTFVTMRTTGADGSAFGEGWIIFVDTNPPAGVVPATNPIILARQDSLSKDIKISMAVATSIAGDSAAISFSPLGTSTDPVSGGIGQGRIEFKVSTDGITFR
ncbi:MAG: GspH/FimT family pseudopilin, partial [Casimicrobium sp.]